MTPYQECQKKGWIIDHKGSCLVTVFDNFILAATAHERITIGYVVS